MYKNTFVVILACNILTVCYVTASDTSNHTATVQLRENHNAACAVVRLGTEAAIGKITLEFDDSKKHVISVKVEPDKVRKKVKDEGKIVSKEEILPDAVLNFSNLVRYYSRPRIQRYTDEQQESLIRLWDSLPAASKRSVTIEVRQDDLGVEFYLDGQYAGRHDTTGKLISTTFDMPKEGEVRGAESSTVDRDPVFLPLDITHIAKPGIMKGATVSPEPGIRRFNGIPFCMVNGDNSVDVGVVRQMKGSWAMECDEHLSRTALDGMPETAHFAVPSAYYVRAWALCAVDSDKTLDPVVTARLTRFARSGRAEAISDTTLVLPVGTEQPAQDMTNVGTIRYTKDGRETEAKLYLVKFDLKPGEILDLLSMEKDPNAAMMSSPYLDFEFLGKLGTIKSQWDGRHKPDNSSTSAVHIFGTTLERSPLEMRLTCGQPGNIFHNDETPEMTVSLKATRTCSAEFTWHIRNIDGVVIKDGHRQLRFETAGAEERIVLPLKTDLPGWYGIDLILRDEKNQELLKHEAAFAQLGRDTRKAGYESPYGTWWFSGAHYGVEDKEIAGPMLFKAGLRKTTFGWTKYSEADMSPWKITLNQLGWGLAPKDMKNPEKSCAEAEIKIREQLERFPHCRSADIFHESYSHYVPAEMLNEEPSENDEAIKNGKERAALGNFVARFYRERFPDIKLLLGNTSSSVSIIASLLRHGFDPKLVDYIGVEAVGQTCMPEKLWDGGTQGIWLAREVARKFGHDLPVTGCYEFTARTDRNLGPRRQAEWIVRDMLLCHAYRFQHINPAIIHDTGNAYFNTLWGAGGLCRRNPLLYPKPAYVGVATLTRVLDQVQPIRQIPTGSTTVYAYEFKRADGNFVCVVWMARGRADLRLQYPEKTDLSQISFYGATKDILSGTEGNLVINADTAPTYVISSAAAKSIEILKRCFTDPPSSFTTAIKMDDAQTWRLEPGDEKLNNPTSKGLPFRVPGTFELNTVTDETMGNCLELKLIKKNTVPDIVGEYVVLKPEKAVPVPGKPATIGLWIKGDSGWGKIIFMIEDAAGTLWRTDGSWHDWPGDLSICHDGWCFMSFPIDGSSAEMNISAGNRWNKYSGGNNNQIQFPIKVSGLSVVLYRRALDLTEMKDVKSVLRLRDLGTCE